MKLCVDVAGFNFIISKCAVTVFVIIANYFYSEFIVFKKNGSAEIDKDAPSEKDGQALRETDKNATAEDNKNGKNK